MKPARFEYARPGRLDEATALLADAGGGARLLAGGQSLGPMLNLRLVQPAIVVDITGVSELTRADEENGALVLGACVTTADIEDGRVPDVTNGALANVARNIAYRAVRNRGTVGGSLAHADPAADWLSALSALGAEVVLRGAGGQRSCALDAFVAGAFETALAEGEMLEAVRVPRLSARARFGYYKFCRRTGEFARAIGAVLHDPERDVCRAVVGAVDGAPIVMNDARPLFGGRPEDGLAARLDPAVAEQALDAVRMTDPFERQIHLAALRRAAAAAEAA